MTAVVNRDIHASWIVFLEKSEAGRPGVFTMESWWIHTVPPLLSPSRRGPLGNNPEDTDEQAPQDGATGWRLGMRFWYWSYTIYFFLGKPIHGGELTVRGVNCDPLLEWYPINQWNRFCHCYRNCDSEKDELFPLDFLDGYTNIILHLHYPTDDSSNNLPIYNFHIFPSIPTISHHVSMTFPI